MIIYDYDGNVLGKIDNVKVPYKESKIKLKTLINTKITIFKESIYKRKKELGSIFYKGWTIELNKIDKNSCLALASLYFIVEGKKFNGKRPKFIQILQIPYRKYNMEFRKIYDFPLKIFSSDQSFKFYFAYALNTMNAVVLNSYTIKELDVALIKKPKHNNPKLHKELNKHFYKLTEYLKYKDIKFFLQNGFYGIKF